MLVLGRTVDKVVEDISKQSPDTIFYIGSSAGFFFIGSGEEYKTDIEDISKGYLKSFKAQMIKAQQTIKELSKPISPKKDESLEKYADRLARISKQLKESVHAKERLKPVIEKWVPIQQRIPTEISKKDELLDPNGTIINMKGIESGGFWFKHEYDTAKAKRGGKQDGAKKDNE